MTIKFYDDTEIVGVGGKDLSQQGRNTVDADALDFSDATHRAQFLTKLRSIGIIPPGESGSGTALTQDQLDKLALIVGGTWANVPGPIASNPAVFAASNTKLTPSNIVTRTYERQITAVTDIDNEWFGVRLPQAQVSDIDVLRAALGSVFRNLNADSVEEVTTAAGFAYYQFQASASQGDVITIQKRGMGSFDGDQIDWDDAGVRQVPDTDTLTASDTGDVLLFIHGTGVGFGGVDGEHGVVVRFDEVSGGLKVRHYWAGATLPDISDSEIRNRYEIDDYFLLDDGRIFKLTASNTASNTTTVTFVAANKPGQAVAGHEISGWNRLAGSTNFGPDPAPIADLPIFETGREDGTETFSRIDVKRFFSCDIGGREVVRLPRTHEPQQAGVFRYANTLPGNKIFDAGTVTMTVHASDGKPFMQTVDHWEAVYIPDSGLNEDVLRNVAEGIIGGGWTDYTGGTVTERPAVSEPVATEPTVTSIQPDAKYGLGQTVSGAKTNNWVEMRIPVGTDLDTTRLAVYDGQSLTAYPLPSDPVTENTTYRWFAQRIPSIPDGAELRMQRFAPMTLDQAFFGSANPPFDELEDGELIGKSESAGRYVGFNPGPGVGNDTRAAERRSDTPVFTVPSRAWTTAFHSTGWRLPEEGSYELVITTAGNRGEPVRFNAKDVRARDEEVNTADTSGAGISYWHKDGIRLGRTADNTLLIASETNFTGEIAGYSFGLNATFSNVPLASVERGTFTDKTIYFTDTGLSTGTLLADWAWGAFIDLWTNTEATAKTVLEMANFVGVPNWQPQGGGDRYWIEYRGVMNDGSTDTVIWRKTSYPRNVNESPAAAVGNSQYDYEVLNAIVGYGAGHTYKIPGEDQVPGCEVRHPQWNPRTEDGGRPCHLVGGGSDHSAAGATCG